MALLTVWRVKSFVHIAMGLLAMFTVLIVYLMRQDDAPTCGCMGAMIEWKHRHSEHLFSLARNGVLLVSGVGLWWLDRFRHAARTQVI